MRKTLTLLALLLVLGGVVAIGWRWTTSAPVERQPGTLAPGSAANSGAPDGPGAFRVTPPRDAVPDEVEPEPGPVVPEPPAALVHRGVMGRVTDTEGRPARDAKVSCSLVSGTGWRHLGWHRCAADGTYAIDVDFAVEVERQLYWRENLVKRLARADRRAREEEADPRSLLDPEHRRDIQDRLDMPLVLEVTASAPENRRTKRSLRLVGDPPDLLRVDLRLESSYDFAGTVVGGKRMWSLGIARSDVFLLDQDWKLLDTTRTGFEGRFRFATPDPGLYIVHARRVGIGAGLTTGFHLGPGLRTPHLEVVLAGGSTLRGRVVLPDGEPVFGVKLIAIQDGLVALDPDRPEYPDPASLIRAEAGGGLALSHAVTDEGGWFSMEAMQVGRYALRFEGLGARHQPRGVFATGVGHEIELTARVLAVVVDASPELALRTRVHCAEEARGVPSGGSAPKHVVRRTVGGQAAFVVDPGTTWRVWGSCHGVNSEEQVVAIDAGTYRAVVVIELDEDDFGELPLAEELPVPPRPARLRVDLLDDQGKPLPAAVTLWRRDRDGETRLHDALPLRPGELLPPLEAGEYRITARPVGEVSEMMLPARETESVRLSPGEARRVTLRTERGGRLALRLVAPEHEAEPSDAWAVQARLFFESGGTGPIPLRFRGKHPEERTRATLMPGQAAYCEPVLPAGRYRLQLLSKVFRSEWVDVEISVGETTPVTIELLPGSGETELSDPR